MQMRNGHKAEARWRSSVLAASHAHDLSLDFLNSNGDPDRKREEFSVPFLDRVAQVSIERELAVRELPELIQHTRRQLRRVLEQRNRARALDERLNIPLHLAVFDSWCEGLTREQVARRRGVSRTRTSQIAVYLRSLDVIKEFVGVLRQQMEPG